MASRLEVDTQSHMALATTASASKLKAASIYGLPSPPDSPMLAKVPAANLPKNDIQVTAAMEANAKRLSIPRVVSWERFKQLVDAEDLKPLGRSYEMQITYEQHKVRMKEKYGSIADYLINYALAEFIADAKKVDASLPLSPSDFMFRANDFPYYLDDNVEHWVLWCKKQLPPGFVPPAAVVDAVAKRFGDNVEWRYFVNPVHRQSVPQLSHAHVFIKHNIDTCQI
ncbi:hypothetical protein IWW36_003284 [Coemansia brasiliensis]|uniref:Uncharacterized protein n=1 Tax=Coemansia brasiliensis TaxID=2650707 RepID=A0A9W8LXD0_9FUNG|nr:hypothetical protein IWW36_003284 [Coemansia brasiliensis]